MPTMRPTQNHGTARLDMKMTAGFFRAFLLQSPRWPLIVCGSVSRQDLCESAVQKKIRKLSNTAISRNPAQFGRPRPNLARGCGNKKIIFRGKMILSESQTTADPRPSRKADSDLQAHRTDFHKFVWRGVCGRSPVAPQHVDRVRQGMAAGAISRIALKDGAPCIA